MKKCNELKNGDLVYIVNIDTLIEDEHNKAVFTEGKIYEIEELLFGFQVLNDNGNKFYFTEEEVVKNLVKVEENETNMEKMEELEKRIEILEEDNKKQNEALKGLTNINNKLVEIIQEKMCVDSVNWEDSVWEVPEFLGYKGKKYKKVNRLAKEGDVIVYPEVNRNWDDVLPKKPYYVIGAKSDNGAVRFLDEVKDSMQVYGGDPEDSEEAVLVYELIENISEPEVDVYTQKVEEAKQFLEDCKTSVEGVLSIDCKEANLKKGDAVSYKNIYAIKNGYNNFSVCKVEFIVLPNKNKVIALLRGISSNKVHGRGVATTYYGDVFNEDIGKAVALAKALGADYSQFTNIPNPMGLKVGSVVKIKDIDEEYKIKGFQGGNIVNFEGKYDSWDFIYNIEKVIK